MEREQDEKGFYVCTCCGYATLDTVNGYNICRICFWEDDGQDDPKADENWGGPNQISLSEARVNFIKVGASDPKDLDHVKKPELHDNNIRKYELINGGVVAKNT